MAKHVLGIFTQINQAKDAVDELKKHPQTKEVSFLYKSQTGKDLEMKEKEDVSTGTVAGGTAGVTLGSILGVAAETITVTTAAGTFMVFGPLAPFMGITGAVAGSLAGGLLGALIDLGVSESIAKQYEDRILKGETLVATSVEEDNEQRAIDILNTHNALLVQTANK